MKPRILTATVTALVCITCAAGLAGCGGAHDIIASGEACTSCHDEKTTYDVQSPTDVVAVSSELTVQTKESMVVVCKPIYISEDGSNYVPQRVNQATVRDGSATLTLEDGIWAVCTADDDKVKSKMLVEVSSSDDAATSIEL